MSSGLDRQGGDLRGVTRRDVLDLSTCVNRYGPPPSVRQKLLTIGADQIRVHPYGADDAVREAYARHLDVEPSELVVARGTTEMIWVIARLLGETGIAVPLPAYTDHIRAAAAFGADANRQHAYGIEGIDRALGEAGTVLVSNPSNPTGAVLRKHELAECCRRHPESLLVVDESYVEFCAQPGEISMIGESLENIVVLRSPAKFYGMAATRLGIAWTLNPALRRSLDAHRGPWILSGLDAELAVTALTDTVWAAEARSGALADAATLDGLLAKAGWPIGPKAAAHFRLSAPPRSDDVAARLLAAGVAVRLLGDAHGFPNHALRITAPRQDEAHRLSAALTLAGNAHG